MATTREYMDYLDEKIEIAPASSEEEYQAAETIADVFQDHGLETTIEEFDARPASTLVVPVLSCVLFVLMLVMGLMEGAVHVVLLLLSIAVVGLFLFLHYVNPNLLESFGPASTSQNVVAVHRATGSKVVKGARPIVIVAHYDTPRESLLRKGPLGRYQATLRKAYVPCTIAIAVALLFQLLLFLPAVIRTFMWVVGLLAALPLLVVAVADIYDRYAPCTLGANDNKSSVAALFAIAQKVAPTGDRVSGDFEEGSERPQRRRAGDAEPEPPAPKRIEVVEEVKGVRHGAEVLASLGILPPTCEVVYQEPRVTVIEEPVEQPEAQPVDEPEQREEVEAVEVNEIEPVGVEDLDVEDAPNDVSYDEESFEDDEPEDDSLEDEAEEEYEEYEEYDDDEEDDEEYEVDYDEYDEDDEPGPGILSGVGEWFADKFSAAREFFSKDRGSDIEIESGEDRRDSDDEDDDIDFWLDGEGEEYEAEDEEIEEELEDEDEYDIEDEEEFEDEEDYLEEDESDEEEDLFEEEGDFEEEGEDEVVDDLEDYDFGEEADLDWNDEDLYEESEEEYDAAEEDEGDFEYDEDEEVEDEVTEEDFEDDYEYDEDIFADEDDDEEEGDVDEDEGEGLTIGQRISRFFRNLRGESDDEEEDYDEDDEFDAAYEEDDFFEDYLDGEEEAQDEADETSEEDFVHDVDDDDYEDEEDYFEDDLDVLDDELEDDYDDVYDEEVDEDDWEDEPEGEEPAQPLEDPNRLHFDREEDDDIVPRDTTGLDTFSDSYDLYSDQAGRTPSREAPEPIDDASWGVSSFTPPRPAMNIARRAALFDLPDPSATSVDPFFDEVTEDEGLEYADQTEYVSEELEFEIDEISEPEAFEAAEVQEAEAEVIDEPDEVDDTVERPRTDRTSSDTGFWGKSGKSDWKGGATPRSDLRDDADEPIVIDEDDLQEAILELGDEFLVAHDIWFVATGASETNHAGIRAFIDEHRRDIRGAFLVNLDSIGAGSLSVLVREGLHAPRRADRRLVRMITGIAQDLHIQMEATAYNWDEREAATSTRARVRSVTITGLDEDNLPAYSHTADDLPENVNPDQVSQVTRIVTELIRRA